MAEVIATYSIVACDLDTGQWGVATQSKFLAVGSVVPWAEPRPIAAPAQGARLGQRGHQQVTDNGSGFLPGRRRAPHLRGRRS